MTKSTILISSCIIALSGCSSVSKNEPPAPTPVVVEQPQNQEVLRALSQLSEIKNELKLLRNTVEELQFETENGKRRQQDLYQDLDRRLVDMERNQRVINPQVQYINGDNEQAGDELAVINSNAENSTTNTNSASASQVLIVDSNPQETSETDNTNTIAIASSDSVSLDEQNAYDQAFELLKQSRYEDSIVAFQNLADTWPGSQLADDAYYWMSEARYVNREFEYALSGFRTVVSRYPDSQRVPEALLKVGYIQYDIGAYDDAANTFRDILARFPGHQVTVSAQTRLRRIEQTIQ